MIQQWNPTECDTDWLSGSLGRQLASMWSPTGRRRRDSTFLHRDLSVRASIVLSSIRRSLSRTYRRDSGRLFTTMGKVEIYNLDRNRGIESAIDLQSRQIRVRSSIGASDALITGLRCVVRQWLNITLKTSTDRGRTGARIVLKSSMDSWMWARFRLIREFRLLNFLDL